MRMLSCLVVVLALVAGCGGEEEIESRARDREIIVDGKIDDWQGTLTFLEDANLSYGLANDAIDLYIVLVVGDRGVRRQIIMSGLYLWFDPEGDKGKRFGIRFPIGLQEDAASLMSLMREQDPSEFQAQFDESVVDMMVGGAGDDTFRRVGAKELDGIKAAAVTDENKLVLEFVVPVANAGSFGYGVGAQAGSVIGLGFETVEIDRDKLREQVGDGGTGGGRGGKGGGGRGGMGGGGRGGTRPSGGQRPEMPDPIEVWAKVRLATGAVQP
jgi:hypothetical protein